MPGFGTSSNTDPYQVPPPTYPDYSRAQRPGLGMGLRPPAPTPGFWDPYQNMQDPNLQAGWLQSLLGQGSQTTGKWTPAYLQSNLPGFAGMGNLLQILMSQGKADPMAMNRLIAQTQRTTQAGQQATQGELAQRGLSGSGIGQALAAAQGQAGQGQIAGIKANEIAQAEERKRQDLQLLLDLFINPQQQYQALNAGQYGQDRAFSQAQRNAKRGAFAQFLEGAVRTWLASKGGGAGGAGTSAVG